MESSRFFCCFFVAHLDATNIHIKIPEWRRKCTRCMSIASTFGGQTTGSFLCFFCEMFGWFLSLKSCGKMIKCLNFLILSVFLFSAHILIFSDFFKIQL